MENENKKVFNKSEIIAALQKDFATTVKKIYINSLSKEVGFREIKVIEQKTLSRIMIDNEQRKDIIYDTQCALINQVCLDEGFDIYLLTEFDKIKLMMALYLSNMYKNEVKFVCKECNTENIYNMNFSTVVRSLDEFDVTGKDFNFENENWKFNFKVGYPTVRRVSDFYRSYANLYRSIQALNIDNKIKIKQLETLNNTINIDYVNNFIKAIDIFNKTTETMTTIDLSDFSPIEVNEVFSSFPLDVLYVENGILNFVAEQFITRINNGFEKHKCALCGAIYEEAVDKDVNSFF